MNNRKKDALELESSLDANAQDPEEEAALMDESMANDYTLAITP
jgi:hypothetical protein